MSHKKKYTEYTANFWMVVNGERFFLCVSRWCSYNFYQQGQVCFPIWEICHLYVSNPALFVFRGRTLFMPRSTRGRSEGSWELCTDVISAGGSRRPKHWRSTLCPVCVCGVRVCVCLYERGHSSLNGPLLQAAISLEPPRPPHDFLRYSLRKDREGQTLSIPLCFFLTVFSAHDSRALWVISTLQHPS